MPRPSKGPRLGSGPAHEKLLLRTLAEQLFENGKVRTTEAKARRLRPLAEKLITTAKKGDLAARRQVMASIANKSVVHTLFTEINDVVLDSKQDYKESSFDLSPFEDYNSRADIVDLLE